MNSNHSHASTLPTAETQAEGACSPPERKGNGLRSQPGDARLPAADATSSSVRVVGYFTLAVVFESQAVAVVPALLPVTSTATYLPR